MKIKTVLQEQLCKLYEEKSDMLIKIGNFLEPDLIDIVDAFYTELIELPEIANILEHYIVKKNLKQSQRNWIHDFFQPLNAKDIQILIERQTHIGKLHANLNINLNFFTHGISIMKREIFSRFSQNFLFPKDIEQAFIVTGQLFDILVSIISEAYFSNEIIHETNELSLKMKGMTQNTAIECERLRSSLLDWMRSSLSFLYRTPEIDLNKLPRLQYSNFGLWVIYKSELLSHTLNVSSELKKYITQIDESFLYAARCRSEINQEKFFESIDRLNDDISKASWFISSIVDQAIEIDTGTDSLTRLFNRRYLDTICRRHTDISMKQGHSFSILMIDIDHFKLINDNYGHDSGDAVLKQFSELLLLSVRTSDFVFRTGGEEFLVLLGNTDEKDALIVAEKIRQKCEEYIFILPESRNIQKTCSIGVATFNGHPDYNRIIKLADLALYEAKEKGRNQAIFKNV